MKRLPMTTPVSNTSLDCKLQLELSEPTVATLNPATMETLQLFRGDTIIVRYAYFCSG